MSVSGTRIASRARRLALCGADAGSDIFCLLQVVYMADEETPHVTADTEKTPRLVDPVGNPSAVYAASNGSGGSQTVPALDLIARLKNIRDRLLSLRKAPKSDSKEMARLWKEVSGIVKAVMANQNQSGVSETAEPADSVIEDIIPMFIQGKVAENMYPVYVRLAKYKHQMEQLLETGLFTEQNLQELELNVRAAESAVQGFKAAAESRTSVSSTSGRVSVASTKSVIGKHLGPAYGLLESKMNSCSSLLKELNSALSAISPFLLPVHQRLVEIKEDLQQLLSRRNGHAFSLAEVQMLQDELLEIDSVRIDGSYLGKDGTVLPGQATVIWLLEQCYEDVHELLALREAISGENPLRPIYESLIRIKNRLDHLQLVIKYSFRCDELLPVQKELGAIDNLRVDGKFVDLDGSVPEGQAVLHFLLHKCYRMVYKIQSMTEPVAESLMPVYIQLFTLRKCFLELQRWKVSLSMRDLTMYQVKLAALDNQRIDGKFCAEDGSIPEGQGILHELLSECYNLQTDLMHASEDTDDDYEENSVDEENEDES
ncbi:hypothetical protein HDU83_008324 [Entophlyctis luteolus]|nr:hypothetical protein HDU83_008324 [Entophlyctis luteolus]